MSTMTDRRRTVNTNNSHIPWYWQGKVKSLTTGAVITALHYPARGGEDFEVLADIEMGGSFSGGINAWSDEAIAPKGSIIRRLRSGNPHTPALWEITDGKE